MKEDRDPRNVITFRIRSLRDQQILRPLRRASILIAVVLISTVIGLAIAWSSLTRHKRKVEAYSEVQHGLRVVIRLNQTLVRAHEALRVEVELVNVGDESIKLYHGYPLLYIAVYNATTGEKIREHPSVSLPVLIATTLQSKDAKSMIYELEFDKPGSYTIAGLAYFSLPATPLIEPRLSFNPLTLSMEHSVAPALSAYF
jgi:hypothetical protein